MIEKIVHVAGKMFGCGAPMFGWKDELEDDLENFIVSDVNFNENLMDKHQQLICRISQLLDNAFKSPIARLQFQGLTFKGVMMSGSSVENLKVRQPDEFDLMVIFEPLEMETEPWKFILRENPMEDINSGNVHFDVTRSCPTIFDSRVNSLTRVSLEKGKYLEIFCPHKMYQKIGQFILKVLEDSDMKYHPLPLSLNLEKGLSRGPAVTIQVEDAETGLKIDVDLVATIQLKQSEGVKLLVPKCTYWRMSHALEEKDLIDEIRYNNPNLITVLKIVKAMSKKKEKTSPLRLLDSYTYKNAFFWFYFENRDEKSISETFKEYLLFLEQVFENGNLPRYFEKSCNLLDRVDNNTLWILAKYLRNIRCRDCYSDFINLNKKSNYNGCFNDGLRGRLDEALKVFLLKPNKVKNNNMNNKLEPVVSELYKYFADTDTLFPLRYVVVNRHDPKILLVFALKGGDFLPYEVKNNTDLNYTTYQILHANDSRFREVAKVYHGDTKFLSAKAIYQVIDMHVKKSLSFFQSSIPCQEKPIPIVPAFIFEDHKEIDKKMVFSWENNLNETYFKKEIEAGLENELNLFKESGDYNRLNLLGALKFAMSKCPLSELNEEVLVTALLNNADNFEFRHSGQEAATFKIVLGYIADSLSKGIMISPIDFKRNVLQCYEKPLLEALASYFNILIDRNEYHTLFSE